MAEKQNDTGIPPLSSLDHFDGKNDSGGEDANESTSTRSLGEKRRFARVRNNGLAKKCWAFVSWTPKRCRWDIENPPKFSLALNLLFGFVSRSSIHSVSRTGWGYHHIGSGGPF
jgi:hypothetical protein